MKKLKEDIVIIEDFITRDEAKKAIELFEMLDKKENGFWKPISFYESYSSGYPEDNDPSLSDVGLPPTWFSDLYKKFRQSTADALRIEEEKLSKISFHSQRWLPGAFAPLHSDNTTNDGTYGAFERSRYATFLYLNDDFEGGELVFPQHNLTIVPQTGMLATFHGGHKNLHKVEIVKNKTRYTIGSFWDDREEKDYPEELRKEWEKELLEVRALQKEESVEWEQIRQKGLRLSPEGKQYPVEEVEIQ